MAHEHTSSPVTRRWIGVLSEERIGQTWRVSDHEELLRNLQLAEELTVLLLHKAHIPLNSENSETSEAVAAAV